MARRRHHKSKSKGPFHQAAHRLLKYPPAWLSLLVLLALILVAGLAPHIAPYSPYKLVAKPILAPQASHLLGTDAVGRDILSRIIYGARVSLSIGFFSALISLAAAIPLALIVGTIGGIVETLIMRFTDGLLAFPTIIIALAVVSVVRPTILTISMAISIAFFPRLLRLIRSEVLIVAKSDFVEAARAIGSPYLRILFHTILPNITSPILVGFAVYFATAILMEAGLSFLGFGVAPPTPTWGFMISQGLVYLRAAPWFSVAPGFAIFIAALALNRFGDALRDVLDPRILIGGGLE